MGQARAAPSSSSSAGNLTLSKSTLKRKSKRNTSDDDDDDSDDDKSKNKSSKNVKLANDWAKLKENCKKLKNNSHDNYDASKFVSQYRKPLAILNSSTGSTSDLNSSVNSAESKSHVPIFVHLTLNTTFKRKITF